MRDVYVVHLVWAPLGLSAVERFVEGYKGLPSGLPHRLAIIFKGFAARADADEHARILDGLEYDSMFYSRPTFDLPAYAAAAEEFDGAHFCFLNSESVLIAPNWLRAMGNALSGPEVGIVGATGSYETPHSIFPSRRHRWPRFPNPHLRTNAFMLSRELIRSVGWPEVPTKARAWELESGLNGLTRHAWGRGLKTCVVGRDGNAYLPHEWPASATFRSGGQKNLLVADNRTREWDEAAVAQQVKLTRRAWGSDPAAAIAEVRRGAGAA